MRSVKNTLNLVKPAMFKHYLLPLIIYLLISPAACAKSPAQNSAESTSKVEYLWKDGAPGFENKLGIQETAQDWWVRGIHNPSLTVFRPEDKTNRTAIIVVPGEGHKDLVFKSAGVKPAKYLQSIGVTAFALKYRLAREDGSPYDIETHAA